MSRYRPPVLNGHQPAVERLVFEFLRTASRNPDYNTANVVHDCVVFVMQNKPPEVERVDGNVVQPIIINVVEQAMKRQRQAPRATTPAIASVQQSQPSPDLFQKLATRAKAFWARITQ